MAMDSTALLDIHGRKLLHELQSSARLSLAELARRIGLSPTATGERLRQMEETGILRACTIEIDRETLGLEVLAFIRMSCPGQNYHRFLNYVQTLEEIRECHHLTGGDDFLIKVTTTSLADLEALIEALLPYGNPVTSLVLSSPIEHRKLNVMGKLSTISKKRIHRR
jgi:Lrp/AsnC family transcriptional regulator, leucine-responsive regulatory protein